MRRETLGTATSSMASKSRSLMTNRVIGVSDDTVAARGPPSSRAISPNMRPGPIRPNSTPSRRATAAPAHDDEALPSPRSLGGEPVACRDFDRRHPAGKRVQFSVGALLEEPDLAQLAAPRGACLCYPHHRLLFCTNVRATPMDARVSRSHRCAYPSSLDHTGDGGHSRRMPHTAQESATCELGARSGSRPARAAMRTRSSAPLCGIGAASARRRASRR
jgi:hypothetical protein